MVRTMKCTAIHNKDNLPFRKGAKSWAGSFLNLSLFFALTTCYSFEDFSTFVFPDVQFSAYRLKKPLLHETFPIVADLSLVLFFPISFHIVFLYFKYLLSFIFKFHKTITRKQILSFVPGKADELTGS